MAEPLPESPPRPPAELAREFGAALRYLTIGAGTTTDPVEIARGGAFFPVIGLALGAVAAYLAGTLGPLWPSAAIGPLGLAVLLLLSRAAFPRALAAATAATLAPSGRGGWIAVLLGWLVAIASTAAKAGALLLTPVGAVAPALTLAGLLGRWAFVVQAYGSQSAGGEGLGAVFPREMKFREFGLASVSAMALTLILANAVGLVLLLWIASQTIVVRILVHRRAGGVGERSLSAGAELAEVATLLLCAALARAITTG